MRILVDIRHLLAPELSGVGAYTVQLLRALFEIDRKNEYVLYSAGSRRPQYAQDTDDTRRGLKPAATYKNVSFVHIDRPNKLLNLRSLLFSHPAINWRVREPIDLIFLPNLNIVTLPRDIPTVLTIHDLSFHHFPEFYSRRMRLWHRAVRPAALVKQASHIITPSSATAQDVRETFGVDDARVSVIPHGVDGTFSPTMEARDHGVRSRLKLPKRFALFVGTLEPRKNLLGIIEGVKRYREQSRDDLALVLAGKWGWNSATLRHRLYKRDVRPWVRLIGYVPEADKSALYRSAQVLVWPSLYEGFGLPVLEAMASGLPVITSRTSSLPELTDGAAVLIDPFHTGDIADALAQVLSSSPLRQTLRQRGLHRATDFSWQKTAQQTLDIFSSF